MEAGTWVGRVNEDGSYSILARICALQGSGTEQAAGEGNPLQQADVSTITCKVYDLGADKDALTGTEITSAPTLTPAANLYDTLQTVGWDQDLFGYNFRHDLTPTYSPDPNEWVRIEYKLTLTGGGVVWHKHLVEVNPTMT